MNNQEIKPETAIRPSLMGPVIPNCLLALLREKRIRERRIHVYSMLVDLRRPLRWRPEYETADGLQRLTEEWMQCKSKSADSTTDKLPVTFLRGRLPSLSKPIQFGIGTSSLASA